MYLEEFNMHLNLSGLAHVFKAIFGVWGYCMNLFRLICSMFVLETRGDKHFPFSVINAHIQHGINKNI